MKNLPNTHFLSAFGFNLIAERRLVMGKEGGTKAPTPKPQAPAQGPGQNPAAGKEAVRKSPAQLEQQLNALLKMQRFVYSKNYLKRNPKNKQQILDKCKGKPKAYMLQSLRRLEANVRSWADLWKAKNTKDKTTYDKIKDGKITSSNLALRLLQNPTFGAANSREILANVKNNDKLYQALIARIILSSPKLLPLLFQEASLPENVIAKVPPKYHKKFVEQLLAVGNDVLIKDCIDGYARQEKPGLVSLIKAAGANAETVYTGIIDRCNDDATWVLKSFSSGDEKILGNILPRLDAEILGSVIDSAAEKRPGSIKAGMEAILNVCQKSLNLKIYLNGTKQVSKGVGAILFKDVSTFKSLYLSIARNSELVAQISKEFVGSKPLQSNMLQAFASANLSKDDKKTAIEGIKKGLGKVDKLVEAFKGNAAAIKAIAELHEVNEYSLAGEIAGNKEAITALVLAFSTDMTAIENITNALNFVKKSEDAIATMADALKNKGAAITVMTQSIIGNENLLKAMMKSLEYSKDALSSMVAGAIKDQKQIAKLCAVAVEIPGVNVGPTVLASAASQLHNKPDFIKAICLEVKKTRPESLLNLAMGTDTPASLRVVMDEVASSKKEQMVNDLMKYGGDSKVPALADAVQNDPKLTGLIYDKYKTMPAMFAKLMKYENMRDRFNKDLNAEIVESHTDWSAFKQGDGTFIIQKQETVPNQPNTYLQTSLATIKVSPDGKSINVVYLKDGRPSTTKKVSLADGLDGVMYALENPPTQKGQENLLASNE